MPGTSGGAPVRGAIATAAVPGYTESRLYPLSVDLGGALRVAQVAATAAPVGAGSTTLLTVTDVVAVAIVAQTVCEVITIEEDQSVAGWPTVNFVVRRPNAGSVANQYIAGRSYAFTAPGGTRWQVGQTVGWVQLPAVGSSTFAQDEQ